MPDREHSPELIRVRFITTHYELLQGLALIPLLAAILLVTVANTASAQRHAGWLFWVAYLAVLPLSIAAGIGLASYYRRKYGRVRGLRHQGFGLVAAALALGVVAGLIHRLNPPGPVSYEGLVFGLGALAAAWFLRPLAVPFLAVGLLGAAASLAPLGTLLGTGDGNPLSSPDTLVIAVFAAWIVVALWSHFLLRAALRSNRTA